MTLHAPEISSSDDRDSAESGDTPQTIGQIRIRKDKTNPRRLAYLCLLLFAPVPEWPLFSLGTVLVIAGILFHGWAAGYLSRAGYASRKEKKLTVRGPYRHNRNPYYIAHMTMDLGFFCMAGLPLFYLLYLPVIFSVYRRRTLSEEVFLEKEFGQDYRDFKQEVPRWGIRLTPATPRGYEQKFEWAILKGNRELPRSRSHLYNLLLFFLYFYFGNPFSGIDPLLTGTAVALVAGWLVVHDIYPQGVSAFRPAWFVVLLIAGVGGAIALVMVPTLWEPWPTMVSWAAIVSGSTLLILVGITATSIFRRRTGKGVEDFFLRPLCQWYTVGLALGLLSGTLGGVWLGILVPLMFWVLNLANLVTPRSVSQSAAAWLGAAAAIVLFGNLYLFHDQELRDTQLSQYIRAGDDVLISDVADRSLIGSDQSFTR